MEYVNYFSKKPNEYIRDFDPILNYVKIQSFFLSRMTGKTLVETTEFVKKNLEKDGKFPIKDRQVKYLSRENQIDRVRAMTTIRGYIDNIRKKNFIMSPAWTAYKPSYMGESLYVSYIDWKSKERSVYKNAMFIAEQRGDKEAVRFNDEMQSSSKIGINSISGAALMPGTINHCQSLHPTLTSTCAASTSLANLNNERLIAGNRPYLSYQDVIDNICSISVATNLDTLERAMVKYRMHFPSTDDVMDCILYSSRNYWIDEVKEAKIRNLVDRLQPLEKAAIVYSGDLYHLYKHNKTQMEEFMNGFTKRTYDVLPMDEAISYMKMADSDVRILAKLICKDYMMGKTEDDVKEQEPEKYSQICANVRDIIKHLHSYKEFIEGFLRPEFVSPGGQRYTMHSLVRKAVLTSDTDSTIFTAQWWVKALNGDMGFEDRHYNVGFTISFLVNKTVFHALAIMSRNMGMEDKNVHMISMKNEYYFPVYVLTNSAKNYYAFKSVREGNVYADMKLEKKGVELRSAKIPKNVMNQFDDYIKNVMNTYIKNLKLTLDDVLLEPYKTETEVLNSVLDGEAKYFQTAQIKTPDGYKLGEKAPPMFYHRLWEEVFAPKYGDAPPRPYVALKISTTVNNKSTKNKWIDSIEDKELARRLDEFLAREGRDDVSVIYAPKLTLGLNTLPTEIKQVMDVNKQLMSVMSPYYLSLESYGIYLRNPNNTTMIHDSYKPKLAA